MVESWTIEFENLTLLALRLLMIQSSDTAPLPVILQYDFLVVLKLTKVPHKNASVIVYLSIELRKEDVQAIL